MDIYGRLASFPLPDLLNLCVETMISGMLTIAVGDDRYSLYFREGHLYHATGPDEEGYAAVWPLFEISDAPYHFSIGTRERSQTISDVTPAVLARARQLAHDWARLRPFVGGPGVVPLLTEPPRVDHVQINEEDWPVLSCIDGQRTISGIAQLAAIDEIAVCYSLLQLQERGLVKFSMPGPKLQLQPVPEASPILRLEVGGELTAVENADGFFTKILATLPLETPVYDSVAALHAPALDGSPFDKDTILRLIRTP